MIYCENSVMTIDAMGCQKAIVKKVREKGADYMIALKANQKTLYTEEKKRLIQVNETLLSRQSNLRKSLNLVEKQEQEASLFGISGIENMFFGEKYIFPSNISLAEQKEIKSIFNNYSSVIHNDYLNYLLVGYSNKQTKILTNKL